MANLNHQQRNWHLSTMVSKGRDVEWTHYIRDGQGRDNYIANNNGGFFTSYYEPGKGLIYGGNQLQVGNARRHSEVSKTFTSGKHTNYIADGSGRDSYIHTVNGGIYPEQPVAQYQKQFKEQLRIGS